MGNSFLIDSFMDMFWYESVSCVCLCLSDEPVLYICMNKCCIVNMFGWPQGR